MTDLVVLTANRLCEIRRTWRIWVLPCVLLVFAVTGPLLAKYLTAILESQVGGALGSLHLPTATALDAYASWVKNLTQVVTFLLAVLTAGEINGRVRDGSALIILSKPVRRSAFVLAAFLSTATLVVISTVLATALTWLVTWLVFPTSPPGPLAAAAGCWLALALLVVAAALLGSALVDAQAGAAGIAIGTYALLLVLGVWPAAAKYSPAGVVTAAGELAAGRHPDVLWPVLTALGASGVLLVIAVAVFRRREL